MQLASRTYEVADLESAVGFCYAQRWSDGLPVIPPTRGAIERIIEYLRRDPQEVVGA